MADVKGKNNFLKMPQLNGVDIIPPGGTTGQQLAKLSGDDYLLQWVDVNVDGLSTAASPTSSIQFNTAGAFDGSADFTFDKTNRRVNIAGASETTQTTIGGTTQVDSGDTNAVLYVEVDASGAHIDGFRTYFNRGVGNFNGWISYDYDGSTPTMRLVDEDDDSPYISFEVIGTGTDAAPQFKNTFGGAGPIAGAEDGFSWKVNGVETMYHSTSQLSFGSTDIYTTDNVFSVYIGDIPAFSMYSDGDWSVLDIHPSPTAGAFLKMYEASNNGTNYVTFAAPTSIDTNQDFVLPSNEATAGDVLNVLSVSGQRSITGWTPRIQMVKTMNTDTTQNINTTTYSIMPLCGSTSFNNSTGIYTIDNSTHQITVAESGWYKVSYAATLYAPSARNSIQTRVHINGVAKGVGCVTYVRNANDHTRDNVSGSELFEVFAGNTVDVRAIRHGNITGSTTIAETEMAFLSIERVQ